MLFQLSHSPLLCTPPPTAFPPFSSCPRVEHKSSLLIIFFYYTESWVRLTTWCNPFNRGHRVIQDHLLHQASVGKEKLNHTFQSQKQPHDFSPSLSTHPTNVLNIHCVPIVSWKYNRKNTDMEPTLMNRMCCQITNLISGSSTSKMCLSIKLALEKTK